MAAGAPTRPWNADEVEAPLASDEPLSYHLLTCSDYLETGTFIVFTGDGGLLFVQTIISSVGMYSQQPGLNVKYIPGGGRAAEQWAVKYSKKDIVLSDDGLSLELCGNSFVYEAAGGEHGAAQYVVRIPATGFGAAIELVFEADAPSFMVSDGKVVFGVGPESPLGGGGSGDDDAPYCRNVFPMARALVRGTMTLKSGEQVVLDGRGFVSKLLQNVKAHKIANTWSLCKFDSDAATLIFVSLRTPQAYGAGWISLGAVIVDGQLVAITSDNTCTPANEAVDTTTGYSLPAATELVLSGVSRPEADQTAFPPSAPFCARMQWDHPSFIDRHDILSSIPWVLRLVVRAFIASPWSYRYYDPAQLTLTVGDAELVCDGMALREFIFLNK